MAIPRALALTVVLEALITLLLGVLLVVFHNSETTVSLVIGIVLIVLAVIVASMLVFPGLLKRIVKETALCDL
jgi:hypothetical protein